MYPFNLLPVRPSPRPWESLSGYLTRLADANRIRSINGLTTMTHVHLGSFPPDFPLPDYKHLARVSGQTAPSLRALTVEYLGTKFGRGGQGQSLGPLLKDAIGTHLRWCPRCVAEQGYYKLPWRFLALIGCSEHDLRLLDRCPACGAEIRLFAQPLRFGICPECETNLGAVESTPLTPEEHTQAISRLADLQFLLARHDWDSDIVFAALSLWLALQRRIRRWEASDVAERLDITTEHVKGMESTSTTTRRGERFAHYLAYADLLDTSFADLFDAVQVRLIKDPAFATRTLNDVYGTYLLRQVQAAARKLETEGVRVTQAAIAAVVDMDVPTLRYYPRVATFLERHNPEEQRHAAVDKLTAQVHEAIAAIRQTSDRVTKAEIARYLNRTPEGFKNYPKIDALIQELVRQDEQAYEDRLHHLVEVAIADLEAAGELVTQASVGRRVGKSPEHLKKFETIIPIMAAIAGNFEEAQQQREMEIITPVEAAIRTLVEQRQLVERHHIARLVGVTEATLYRYPVVKRIIQDALKQYKDHNRIIKYEQREAQIIAEIASGVAALRQQGRLVTRSELLAEISVSIDTIRRYNAAYALFLKVVED